MKTFKEFLSEAKKPKEPDWPDADWNSGYSQLRDKQSYLTIKPERMRLQMFVPKHRDPQELEKNKRNRDWIQIKREIPDEITEASIPILTSFKEAPPGDNKPEGTFWTSSAIQKPNGKYTSDWYNFVKQVFPTWQTDYGYLFEIDHSALIYDAGHLDQFYDWAEDYNKITKKSSEWVKDFPSMRMRDNFPWDVMARHFDGVRHTYTHNSSSITYGWDVESTAWFNTKVLKYKGAVKLFNGYEDDE